MGKSRLQYLGLVLIGGAVILGGVLLLDLIPDRYQTAAAPWLVVAMTPAATLFPLLYLTFYRWYKNPVGRALMTKAVGLALLIDVSVWFQFMGENVTSYHEEIQTLIFLLILAGLWYQLTVFIKIKVQAKQQEKDLHDGIPNVR